MTLKNLEKVVEILKPEGRDVSTEKVQKIDITGLKGETSNLLALVRVGNEWFAVLLDPKKKNK